MERTIAQDHLLAWALGLIAGFPLLTIVLGELAGRVARRRASLASALTGLKNLALPVLAVELFLRRILLVDPASVLLRVVDTLLWIVAIHAGFSLVNALIFADARADTWQARVPKLLRELMRFALILAGAAVVLSAVWGVDLSGLVTALGIGSVVIALALQDTLSNLVSGVLLVFDRPFKLGDWLRAGDIVGQVVEINWRAVRLRTRDNDLIVIPNGVLGKGIIHNFSQPTPLHAERMEVTFSYRDPPNRVRRVLEEVALATEGVTPDPPPDVRTMRYGDFSIAYQLKFYLGDFDAVDRIRNELTTRLYYAAKRHGLTMPTPTQKLYHFDGQTSERDAASKTSAEKLSTIHALLPLEHATVDEIAKESALRHYGAGERIVRAGEPGEGLYILLNGRAAVTALDRGGRERQVSILSRGDIFGEIALSRGDPSPVALTAIDDLEIVHLPPGSVMALAERSPRFAQEIEQLIEAQRKAVRRIREAATIIPGPAP